MLVDWLSVPAIEALTAVGAISTAIIVYVGDSRRTDFEAARALHLDLTSGEVAVAREQLGTLRYGSQQARQSLTPSAALTAYFSLLWSFERIYWGRQRIFKGHLVKRRKRAALKFLDGALSWHLQEWAAGLLTVRTRLETLVGVPIDDCKSRSGLRAVVCDA